MLWCISKSTCTEVPYSPSSPPATEFSKTAKKIAEGLKGKNGFHVAVIRSIVLSGNNRRVGEIVEEISRKKRNIHFAVVSDPEFLREGESQEKQSSFM